ncbi:MAG: hypothetical protein WC333_09435 [Dehalococcoidia bacterium]|jgi:hypothetical protein
MTDQQISAMTAGTPTATDTFPFQRGGTANYQASGSAFGAGTILLPYVTPGTSGNVLTSNGTAWTSMPGNGFEGFMQNGKIVVTVASNNLTVAVKGLDGNDPSASNPVKVRINGVIRTIVAALSVTIVAGANTFNAGSAELATKEIDYFCYLGYNATDGVTIGFSRIPFGNIYSDFSATTTNEKYCAISTITNAVATDSYVNIGRFAATLSAGAGYTWTVPTFTANNLIQRPIFETRRLVWVPTVTSGTGSITTLGTITANYVVRTTGFDYDLSIAITTNGTGASYIKATAPFVPTSSVMGVGKELNVTGKMITNQLISSAFSIVTYDNVYPGGDGYLLSITGSSVLF